MKEKFYYCSYQIETDKEACGNQCNHCKNPKGNIFKGGFQYNRDAERAIMYSALRRNKKAL